MIYDRMVHVMIHARLEEVIVSFEFPQTSDRASHIRLFHRSVPYTPSHVLHKNRRVSAKCKGHTIHRPNILCK